LGGWTSPTGEFVVEASQSVDNKFEAVRLGMQRNQEGIWDNAEGLKDKNKGYIMTYGTGVHGQPNMNYNSKVFGDAIHDGYAPTGTEVAVGKVVGAIGMPTNFNTTSLMGLSEGAQKKTRQLYGAQGLTPEDVAGNIYDAIASATPQQIADGMAAYARYNAEAENMAHEANISPSQAAAVIAILSPQTPLGSNIAMAHYLTQAIATDKMIDLPDAVVAAANEKYADKLGGKPIVNHVKLSQQPSYYAQAVAIMRSATNEHIKTDPQYGTTKASNGTQGSGIKENAGNDKMADAISIIKGVDEDGKETDIDRILSGHKVRSFYNNIINPDDPRFVTIDGFMVGIGMGEAKGNPYGASAGKIGTVLIDGPAFSAENAVGGYALIADATRAASAKINRDFNMNLTPDQAQAIAWIASGGGKTKGKPGIPVVIPRPEPPAPQGEQLQLQDQTAGVTGDFTAVSSKTLSSAEVIGYVGPTVSRKLITQAAADKEFERRIGYAPDIDLVSVSGVKAADGKIVLSVMDGELDKQSIPEEFWKYIPSKAHITEILSTLADRYDKDNLGLKEAPIAYILGPHRTCKDTGQDPKHAQNIMAWTTPTNPGLIKINGASIATIPLAAAPGSEGFAMPVASRYGVSQIQYTVTHEFGHLTEFAHNLFSGPIPEGGMTPDEVRPLMEGRTGAGPKLVKGMFMKANELAAKLPPNTGLSEYGKTNAHEAYAEAFTEFTLTGGKTDNKVAQLYGKAFNWANPDKLAPGSTVSPIPGLSPLEELPGDNDSEFLTRMEPNGSSR
jgi:hypothetical protein